VAVTDSVKQKLKEFVKNLSYGGESRYVSAILRFQQLIDGMGYDDPNNTLQSEFILVSDGILDDSSGDVDATIAALDKKHHIHTMVITNGEPGPKADAIACAANGVSLALPRTGEAWEYMDALIPMIQYFAARVADGKARLTFPYVDATSGLQVLPKYSGPYMIYF